MKTITEFTGSALKNALKARQDLVATGKTPEELPAALGEALKLEGDKLALIASVMDVVEKKMQDLKRVVVFTLQETEKAPSNAQKNGENYFSVEYFPPMPGTQKRPGQGKDRDDRGGRGGRDRKGAKGGKRGDRNSRDRNDQGGSGPGRSEGRPSAGADRPRPDRPQRIGGIPVVFAKDTTGPGNPGAPITDTPAGGAESRGGRNRRPRAPRPEVPQGPLLPPDPSSGRKVIQPLATPTETKPQAAATDTNSEKSAETN
jgi:hypothetical protein